MEVQVVILCALPPLIVLLELLEGGHPPFFIMTNAMVRYVAISAPEPNPTLPLPLNPTPPFSLEQCLQCRVYFPGDPDVSRCRGEAQEAGPGCDYRCQWGSTSSWDRGTFLCGGE